MLSLIATGTPNSGRFVIAALAGARFRYARPPRRAALMKIGGSARRADARERLGNRLLG
jgi:hypothetical protein